MSWAGKFKLRFREAHLLLNSRLAQIVICMMSMAIFFSYCLQFYVPVDILLPWFKSKIPSYPLTVEYTLRYTLVLITCT